MIVPDGLPAHLRRRDVTDETVDVALRALVAFAGVVTREEAAALLSSWRYYRDLTLTDRAAVLDRFPARRLEPGCSGPGG